VTGVEEGLVPLDREGMTTDPDEERRLLYVALTRARRLAVISWAKRRTVWGKALPGRPSPFLAQLPADAVVHTDPEGLRPDPSSKQLRLF
jgi:DNA helicase-2/ATP-dependent DNA helicase PcrA